MLALMLTSILNIQISDRVLQAIENDIVAQYEHSLKRSRHAFGNPAPLFDAATACFLFLVVICVAACFGWLICQLHMRCRLLLAQNAELMDDNLQRNHEYREQCKRHMEFIRQRLLESMMSTPSPEAQRSSQTSGSPESQQTSESSARFGRFGTRNREPQYPTPTHDKID